MVDIKVSWYKTRIVLICYMERIVINGGVELTACFDNIPVSKAACIFCRLHCNVGVCIKYQTYPKRLLISKLAI